MKSNVFFLRFIWVALHESCLRLPFISVLIQDDLLCVGVRGFLVLAWVPVPRCQDPMKADCWNRADWTFRHFEETLRDKLLAKSNQVQQQTPFKTGVGKYLPRRRPKTTS